MHCQSAKSFAIALMASLVLTAMGTTLRADVSPPVSIKLVGDPPEAKFGERTELAFDIKVGKPGQLTNLQIDGHRWHVVATDLPESPLDVEKSVIRVNVTAIPVDADEPIGISFYFNGRLVRRVFEVGPAVSAKKEQQKYFIRVPGTHGKKFDEEGRPQPVADLFVGDNAAAVPTAVDASDATPSAAGGAIPFRAIGRIMYDRPGIDRSDPPDGDFNDPGDTPPVTVGADGLEVLVADQDTFGFELIWGGVTDEQGYFDSGVISWDDCDILGCDTPDIIFVARTKRNTFRVMDSRDDTYQIVVPEMVDFEGSFIDYGVLKPHSSIAPAFQIFTSILRAERIVTSETNFDTDNLEVFWPDDSQGGGAWYDPSDEVIHISTEREWSEATAIHEYGHHHNYTHYDNPLPEPAYCDVAQNCDPNPPDNCGHCMWCSENDFDAWGEGWCNWLADFVTREFPKRFEFDDGTPYTALITRSQEFPRPCDVNYHDPVSTEGFVGALLRDIDDETQDDHDDNPGDDVFQDGIFDNLCLGMEEILHVTYLYEPNTVTEFINAFRVEYPPHAANLWGTAFNVGGPQYVASFPNDTDPPGLVSAVRSSTHPSGVGGSLPCITFEFEPASDDVRGANTYSYVVTRSPGGLEPDEDPEPVRPVDDCAIQGTVAAGGLGDWYISIKAMDNAGRWSNDYLTAGPFTVTDCNNNGVLDVCDTDCGFTQIPGVCNFGISPCNAVVDCMESSSDCQPNFKPDECDINEGESDDCDVNGTPDECQIMKHFRAFDDPPNGFLWGLTSNWEEGQIPVDGDSVCIPADAGVVTVIYEEEDTHLNSMANYRNFIIAGAVFPAQFPRPDLELDENSFVLGEFQMEGNSTLTVNDRLYVDEIFHWMDGRIDGNGVVEVADGVRLTRDSVDLVGATLRISSGESFSNGPRIGLSSGADVIIRDSATYTYEGNSVVFNGGGGLIDLDGTLICDATDDFISIGTPLDNSGLIHSLSAKLVINNGGNHTGEVRGDPGTTLGFQKQHEFEASSTLTADTVEFGASNAESMIHGTVDISERINGVGGTWTFADDANIVNYGNHVYVERGRVNFNAPVDAPIDLQTITITTPGESAGRIDFNTGEPVNCVDMDLIAGSLYGPSPINVSGLFSWTRCAINPGGAITASGPVMINATSSSRTIRRHLNVLDQATIRSGFGIGSGARLNIFDGAVVNMQFNSGAISGGTFANNGGTVLRTSGDGFISITGAVTNDGLIHNQTGTLNVAPHGLNGVGVHTGDVLSDADTRLILGGTQTFTSTSSITAETLELAAGNNKSVIHGTVNVSDRINVKGGGNWRVADDATIVDLGDHLYAERGRVTFNSPTDRPIELETLTITSPGEGSGTVKFDTGQPVNVTQFDMIVGVLEGPSPINVSDEFSWTNGSIFAGGPLTSNGVANINPTNQSRTISRVLINNGDMIFRGGFGLGGSARLENTETGFIDFQLDFRVLSSRPLNNAGTVIRSSNDGTSTLQNVDVNNTGTIEVQQGTLLVSSATVTQTAGETIINAGTSLQLSMSDPFALEGGVFKGNGNFFGDLDNSGGAVAPGLSIGELNIGGDYDQPGGALDIEIDDMGADKLNITGNATLGGALVVTHLNGFVPEMTDEFVILEAASVNGEFDDLSIPPVYEVLYNPTNVTLSIAAVSPDLNGDGVVNLLDFQLFQECFNGEGNMVSANCDPTVNADFDQDGDVDLFDFERLATATTP